MLHAARRRRLVTLAAATLLAATLTASGSGSTVASGSGSTVAHGSGSTVASGEVPQRYVALGDSFTAAPGVPESTGGVCARSTHNYPSVIARALPGTTTVDVSCSGADTTHMRGPQMSFGQVVPPQFSALDADTDLVTIGIGGNDFGVFATTILECPLLRRLDPEGAPCKARMRTSQGTGDVLLNKITRTEKRILKVVRGARQRSPQARILLVGYPQLVPARGTCALLPLAKGDYRYGLRINKALDGAVRRVAKRTGSDFVNVWKASRGHDVCSEDPWVNGKRNTDQAILYHPFAKEQEAVAGLILSKLD